MYIRNGRQPIFASNVYFLFLQSQNNCKIPLINFLSVTNMALKVSAVGWLFKQSQLQVSLLRLHKTLWGLGFEQAIHHRDQVWTPSNKYGQFCCPYLKLVLRSHGSLKPSHVKMWSAWAFSKASHCNIPLRAHELSRCGYQGALQVKSSKLDEKNDDVGEICIFMNY